jgi:glycosyltransferase involved in cell wall biosynthesis
VLQLSTSKLGGAGISAAILDQKLREDGVESRLFTRPDLKPHQKFLSKAVTFVGKVSASDDYDFLSSNSTSTLDYKEVLKYDPQIIHIHNWYNLLSIEDFSKLGKLAPLIFTLHDERPATGGCHVTLGCKKYLEKCDGCPAHRLKLSQERYRRELESFYKSGQEYSVITPSFWMMNQMRGTALLSNAYSTAVIPNHLSSVNHALVPFRLNSDQIELIFVASSMDTPYKGIQILFSAMRTLDSSIERFDKKIHLTLIGYTTKKAIPELKNISVQQKDHLSRDILMNLMRESDILVVPSLSENYPGVIAEGQAHGARVVAHRVGGIPEMINDGVTGYLCDPDANSLAKKILEAILDTNSESVRLNAFQEVLNRQNSITINASHLDFYTKILERKKL